MTPKPRFTIGKGKGTSKHPSRGKGLTLCVPFPLMPNMDDRLARFRAEREAMRRHLAWLDNEIAALERSDLPADPPADAPASPTTFPPPHVAPLPEIHSGPSGQEEEVGSLGDLPPSNAAQQAKQVRSGCIAVAIIGMILALAAIYGLPYLIYK